MDVEINPSSIFGAGRGIFATKDFEPGDVVLSVNRPYVAELEIERMKDTCAWCFMSGEYEQTLAVVGGQSHPDPSAALKACTGCRKAKYCSKTCQTRAWKREHKYECKVLVSESTPDLPHGVRAVIKLLGRLVANPDKLDEQLLSITSFRPGANDASLRDFERRAPDDYKHFSLLAYGAWKYAGSPDLETRDAQALAKSLFVNISCNAFTLSSPLRDEPLGIGFDPILCSINHSCEPNAQITFNQPVTHLRALRPLKAGSEIFIKYTDVTNPFSLRQSELKHTWFFSCQCPKCRRGASGPEDAFLVPPEKLAPSSVPLADNLILRHAAVLPRYFVPCPDETFQRRVAALQAEAFAVSGASGDFVRANRRASVEEVRAALRMCRASGLWGWTRQPVPHLVRQLLLAHLEGGAEGDGKAYPAWRIGAKMAVEILPVLHPEAFQAERVVHDLLMMRLTNELCQPENAEVYREVYESGLDLRTVFWGFLVEFYEQARLGYGPDSPMGRLAETIYRGMLAQAPVGEEEIKRQVREAWPKFEIVAKSVDILGF